MRACLLLLFSFSLSSGSIPYCNDSAMILSTNLGGLDWPRTHVTGKHHVYSPSSFFDIDQERRLASLVRQQDVGHKHHMATLLVN